MKILVTGCNGLIGRAICAELKRNKIEVVGVDLSTHGCSYIDYYIQADLSNQISVSTITDRQKNCDCIVHTAASLTGTNAELMHINCVGTLTIIEIAKILQVKQIINMSGIPVIGRPKALPITEQHPVEPPTVYLISKYTQELLLNRPECHAFTVTHFRVPSPVGIGLNEKKIVSAFVNQCLSGQDIVLLGKGTREQNYIDVRDIANAVLLAVKKPTAGLFLLGACCISNHALALLCKQVTGSSSVIHFSGIDPDDDIKWDICTKKAFHTFGFVSRYSMEEMIASMLGMDADE